MNDDRRTIRISISEPTPGWWDGVKALAQRRGVFVSRLVIAAIEEHLQKHRQEARLPHLTYDINRPPTPGDALDG